MSLDHMRGRGNKDTYRAQQPVVRFDDLISSVEEQERAGTIGTFSLALGEAFVANEGTLLVSYEPTDWYTGEGAFNNVTVDLGSGDDPG